MSRLSLPRYLQIAADITSRIDNKEYPDGYQLPSRSVLATRYGVSHITIQAALKELTHGGQVRTRRGAGVYVQTLRRQATGPGPNDAHPAAYLAASTVAVIGSLPSLTNSEYLHKTSGWQSATVIGTLDALRKRRWHPLIIDPNSADSDTIEHVYAGIGGAVVTDYCPADFARSCVASLLQNGVPVASGNEATRDMSCDQVRFDFERGGYLLAEWLFERGRRRLAPMWIKPVAEHFWKERHAGYTACARQRGIDPIEPVTMDFTNLDGPGTFEIRSRVAASYVAELMSGASRPDALLLPSDGYVPVFARALRLNGLEPNVDIDLAGYDNYWIDAPEREFDPTPPVVTIDKNNLMYGAEFVRTLDDRKLSGPLTEAVVRLVEPTRLTWNELESRLAPSGRKE